MLDEPSGMEVAARSSPANRREMLQTLEELRAKTGSRAPECRCEIYEDLSTHNRFLWTEWWPTAGGVRQSLDSDRFRALMAAIRVLGTLEYVRLLDTRPTGADGAPGPRPRQPTSRNPTEGGSTS